MTTHYLRADLKGFYRPQVRSSGRSRWNSNVDSFRLHGEAMLVFVIMRVQCRDSMHIGCFRFSQGLNCDNHGSWMLVFWGTCTKTFWLSSTRLIWLQQRTYKSGMSTTRFGSDNGCSMVKDPRLNFFMFGCFLLLTNLHNKSRVMFAKQSPPRIYATYKVYKSNS